MSEENVEERELGVFLNLVGKFEARIDSGEAVGKFDVGCGRGILA